MEGFAGKNVLVTGGSSGIGQAIAIRLGNEGANVAINYRRDEEGAEETRDAIERAVHDCVEQIRGHGARPILVAADVSDSDQVRAMVETVVKEFGGLDILVNNAGIQSSEPSESVSDDAFSRVLSVNLHGAFYCAREAIQHFLATGRGGIILNVSSVHEAIPKPQYLSYSVSKGGLGNMTRTLALEYAGRRIRVNSIAPGAIVTSINRAWVDDPDKRSEVESHIPMSRAGEADEIAAAAAFLCSDEASYITGQTLFVDGGLTLYPDFREPWSSE